MAKLICLTTSVLYHTSVNDSKGKKNSAVTQDKTELQKKQQEQNSEMWKAGG